MRLLSPLEMLSLVVLGIPVALEAQVLPEPDTLPPGVTAEMIARGKAVFEGEGLCANCHGADATGLLGPDLTDSEWWQVKGSYLAIVKQVLDGVPAARSQTGVAMPTRGGYKLSDGDVQAVAGYVWRLSHPDAGDSLPVGVTQAMVERGRTVFAGEGGCAVCHGPDATGGVGPDLTDDSWLHAKGSYLAIVGQILMGVPVEKSRGGVAMPPRGGSNISDAEVHAVAAYVWALSHRYD